MKDDIKRWIILPDMQVKYEDKRSVAAVEQYMGSRRWDGYLNLGDFLDFNEISRHVKGKPGAVTENVADTFEAGRVILKRHAQIMRKNNVESRMVLLQGNHDYRAVSYAEEFPHLKKHLDVPTNLGLAELRIEWVKSWEKGKLFKIGNAHFLHGNYINKYHAAKMVDAYGVCVYYGHTHDVMFFPKMTKGNGQTLEGGSLGCLCDYKQSYMKGRPSNWIQAVSTLYVQPNGNFNLYTSKIFNHRFVAPDGVTYQG